jgi:DNA-binding winged helix-turn-helix (wHTH) protein/predicted ATPase
MEHAGELVTKEALYEVVWQAEGIAVGDDAITTCIYEIRQALGEETKVPHYIETRPKYGYCFIGPIATAGPINSQQSPVTDQQSQPTSNFQPPVADAQPSALNFQDFRPPAPSTQPPTPPLVGREAELAQLQQHLEKALSGERQLVFVTGEAGIGKTSLVRVFLRQIAASDNIAIGRGQCIEHYGPGEAYLPVLEALGRLCRDPRGAFLVEWMKQYLPTWLVQIPALLSPTDREELQYKVQGATRGRMLREMSEGIEMLTQQFPFVLVLEDLHWSDASTLDLLASIARRQESARLLVIGTCRPEEGLMEGHPLRAMTQELRGHELCQDLALTSLSETAVAEYLEQCFPASALPTRLPEILHRRTGGNPLFLVAVVDDLRKRGVIAQTDGNWGVQGEIDNVAAETPENIRQLISKQIERLNPEERRLLQAASLAGFEFSTAAVAAAAEVSVAEVEERCAVLAQRQHFVQQAGLSEWPDGTREARYRFRHAVYQYLWSERVTPYQRPQLHQKIGERLEAAYGSRTSEIAAELAVHFEQGRDYEKAVRYLQRAGQNATRRSAHVEASGHFAKGLELLQVLPNIPRRSQQELELQIALGTALMLVKGYGSPDAARAYARARELCQQIGETPQLLSVQQGLARFYTMRAEYQTARELTEQLLTQAQRLGHQKSLLEGRQMLGLLLFHLGELEPAHAQFEQALSLSFSHKQRDPAASSNPDPIITCLAVQPLTWWLLGYPERALQSIQEGLNLVRERGNPHSLAFVLSFALALHHYYRDRAVVQARAEELQELATTQDFALWSTQGAYWLGWVHSEQGEGKAGLAQLQQALTAWQATGAELGLPFYLSGLVRAYGKVGRASDGLRIVVEALERVERTGERFWEAELWRLKGELLLQQSDVQSVKPGRGGGKVKST